MSCKGIFVKFRSIHFTKYRLVGVCYSNTMEQSQLTPGLVSHSTWSKRLAIGLLLRSKSISVGTRFSSLLFFADQTWHLFNYLALTIILHLHFYFFSTSLPPYSGLLAVARNSISGDSLVSGHLHFQLKGSLFTPSRWLEYSNGYKAPF